MAAARRERLALTSQLALVLAMGASLASREPSRGRLLDGHRRRAVHPRGVGRVAFVLALVTETGMRMLPDQLYMLMDAMGVQD